MNTTVGESIRHRCDGKGRPLLLIHGLGSSSRTWEPILSALTPHREVVAIDLPGFGNSPALPGPVSIASLTNAVEAFIHARGLGAIDVVGSSMGARMALELACRGHAGTIVALDPGGFWTTVQRRVFAVSIGASIALVRGLRRALPALTGNPLTRTLLLAQFSAQPWKLDPALVLTELRGYVDSPSIFPAFDALAYGPNQRGIPPGTTTGRIVIGWGRRDRVTVPSQSGRVADLFPGAELHWFDSCGHFPHWDQPGETSKLILEVTGGG